MSGVMIQLPVEIFNELAALAEDRLQQARREMQRAGGLVQAIQRNRVVIEPPTKAETDVDGGPVQFAALPPFTV